MSTRQKTNILMIIFLFTITPLIAGQISTGQREKGEVVLTSLSVKNGKLSFGTETGGCTDKKSFKVNIEAGKGISGKVPNYNITITRVFPDECKGFFMEGIVIEYDLEKDLGIKGDFTVTVKNMVLPWKE